MPSLLSLTTLPTNMLRPGVLRSSLAVTIITTIISLALLDLTSAKAVRLNDGYLSALDTRAKKNYLTSAKAVRLNDGYLSALDTRAKKNSWWSKKSLDSSNDYQSLLQDLKSYDTSEFIDSKDTIISLFSCYVQICAPKFVRCAQDYPDIEGFEGCKGEHLTCSKSCLNRSSLV